MAEKKERKQWLYKQGEDAKIFIGKEIAEAIKNGWVDSPAKFVEGKISEPLDLNTLSDEELKDLAKEAKVPSYHLLGRDKLIAALQAE